ncbi:MAG TPA: hypothetical protein RMH99_27310 [Sandaracinaceae bacterium LLY-WYZ-13_1]|nr:hypothetical protein [Sandaracinaceae bacterium LLY-WYZ-13_1]
MKNEVVYHVAALCLAATVVGPPPAEAQFEELSLRRFHAQLCGYEGNTPEDLRVFGWEVTGDDDDGRIENQSGGAFPQTRDLVCPVITDSVLPHQDITNAVVHGIDDSDEVEVEVYACLGAYNAMVAECAPSSGGGPPSTTYSSGSIGSATSDPSYVGPFVIPVDVSVFTAHDSQPTYHHGYPVLIVRLPTNEATRITGYSLCAAPEGDEELCEEAFFEI